MQDFLKFWSIDQAVFARPVPETELFTPPRLRAQLDRLLLCAQQGQPVILVSGESGTGKSTILRWLAQELRPETHDVLLAAMVQKEATPGWLTPRLAALMGEAEGKPLPDLMRAVARRMDELVQENRKLIVAVDAVHMAETETALDEIVSYLNLQALGNQCLSFVLAGAPSLKTMIAQMPALQTRIAYHLELPRLNREETAAYIDHRARIAGISGLFEAEALDFVYLKSRGVIAAINTQADACLMEAFQRKQRRIGSDIIRTLTGPQNSRESGLIPPPRMARTAQDVAGAAALVDEPAKSPEGPTPAEAKLRTSEAPKQDSASIKLASLFKSEPGPSRPKS